MTDLEKSKRRVELMKKRLTQGLTLTEAHELATLEDLNDIMPWKLCEQHDMKFLYASKCPNCLE